MKKSLISLEEMFEEACGRHEHLKILESQWRFDKQLISKALQNISSIFPHYSRHDSSHSKQIIINIERMLGERICYLTATDIWLILEAAYSHDIGMVVTHKQILDMDTADFKSYVQDIADQPDHELYEFASKWVEGSAKLPEGSAAHVFFDEYRQLLAEWYRRKHPENSAKIIHDPFQEIGLTSPRNELLPKRLFGILEAICEAHGQPFEKVMELPFSEAGMATEDCHPRYVAFLLRMGDLLDVDDNRFCPVMMRMSGASLPAHSHAHLEKHQGIKNFRLDSERIKIDVVCPSLDSYEVTHDWFKWLEKEYHSQSQHWPKIVPNKKLGRLPTLSPTKISLKKPYLVINEGRKPCFELNKEMVFGLLRGTGLYSSKSDSIREILQNAVDSTIIAIWDRYKDLIPTLDPLSDRLHVIYSEYPISVSFVQCEKNDDTFKLVVKDSGVGISKNDLEHMLTIGGSRKNSKSKMIRKMPNWFKPSGNFGIGLQSINMLSESFTVTTKSRLTHEAFKLTFNMKAGSSIVIEVMSPEEVDYGAVFSVDIRVDKFPERISIPLGREGKALKEKLGSYDFTKPESDLKVYEQLNIFKAIAEFNCGSQIPINFGEHTIPNVRVGEFFSKRLNIIISNVSFGYSDYCFVHSLFRGQPFSDLHPASGLYSGTFDFYGHQAMDFLTYNRDKILPKAKSQAVHEIEQALIEYIEASFDSLRPEEKPCAAVFCFLYGGDESWQDRYHEYLMNYKVSTFGGVERSLSEVVDEIKSRVIKVVSALDPNQAYAYSSMGDDEIVLVGRATRVTSRLIKYLGTKAGLFWQENHSDILGESYSWSLEDIQPVSDQVLREIMSGQGDHFHVGCRILFPAWKDYRKLSVEANIYWARMHEHVSFQNDLLVLPYSFNSDSVSSDLNNDLVKWVFEHRKNKCVTIDEIRSLYEKLLEEIDGICSSGAENNPRP